MDCCTGCTLPVLQAKIVASVLFICVGAAATHEPQLLPTRKNPLEEWNAVVALSDATIQVIPQVFRAGILSKLWPALGTRNESGLAFEASFRDLILSLPVGMPLAADIVNISLRIGSLKWRLEMLLDDATGKTTFRDFQILHLGQITVLRGVDSGFLDTAFKTTLNFLVVLAHDYIQRIAENVGRSIMRETL
ncbi:hypothetical protein V5799_029662 [Amblyomma americanum]|uniref:Uncharacterized protein n=1 Tax=Amblyomma americanum TaxID=6943 RepID=A0AAQ4EQI7_AMBAM